MSFFLIKSILALVFFVSALGAATSMLTMMGKADNKIDPKTLKAIHKVFGRVFLILLPLLIFLGMRHWVKIGDQASVRAVFHAVLALGLTFITLLKLSIVKSFKQFLRLAPGLGMTILGLTFVVFSISAGFHTLQSLSGNPASPEEIRMNSREISGNVEKGAVFFNANCLSCHYPDSQEKKFGPGMKDLFKKDRLPHSGLPVTVENIKRQLIKPALAMPSFPRLTEQEFADLIAYLKTL